MVSRRSLLCRLGGLTTGSLALIGSVGTTAAHPATTGADGGQPHVTANSATTITARANRTAIRSTPVPTTVAPLVADFERRFDAVSLATVTSIAGSARVTADGPLDGTLVASGSFPVDAVREDLGQQQFSAAGTHNGVERFVRDDGLAVGVASSAVVLGYDRRTRTRTQSAQPDAGLARVDAALGGSNAHGRRRGNADRATAAGSTPTLDSVLSGDVTVAAALDANTRNRLATALSNGPGPIADVLGRSEAIGTAASIRSDGRTDVRHGLVAEPERLSVETVRDVIDAAEIDEDAIDSVAVDRNGRVVVVDATVATDRLLRAHLVAGGFQNPFDAR